MKRTSLNDFLKELDIYMKCYHNLPKGWISFDLEAKHPIKYCSPELYSKVNQPLHCVKI